MGTGRMPLSGSGLKIIAILIMFIDHFGAVLAARFMVFPEFDNVFWTNLNPYLRNIGRLAFPIFCFLLVEGFTHTKNVKKYLERMLLFALISELPFNLAITGKVLNSDAQNVFWQLSLGILAMLFLKKAEESRSPYLFRCVYQLLIVLTMMFIAEAVGVDYGANGMLSICVLYVLRQNRALQLPVGALSFVWELPAVFAFPLLALYNGKRGRNIKNAFYIFYPAHLLLLYVVARVAGCPY